MADLIDRQVAIDAICSECSGRCIPCESYPCGEAEVLKRLPSAQPEIIRCKECEHLQKWRSEESVKKFGQIYECARNVLDCPKPEDFCSHAERRADDR